MSDREDRRDEQDEELDDMRPRRRRDNDEDEDQPRRKSRRAQPQMQSFTVMYEFGKFNSVAEYAAPEGYTPDDIEDFIFDQKDQGYKVYRVHERKREDREKRRNYGRGRGYDSRRHDD